MTYNPTNEVCLHCQDPNGPRELLREQAGRIKLKSMRMLLFLVTFHIPTENPRACLK